MAEITEKYANLSERSQKITFREGQKLRMLHDNFDFDWKSGDEPHGTMIFTDESSPVAITEPPRSSHISILIAVDAAKARPAKVKRVWQGQDYYYDCFATQTVKDEFVVGKIAIGDYVIVHFDDIGEQIVIAKVFKSW